MNRALVTPAVSVRSTPTRGTFLVGWASTASGATTTLTTETFSSSRRVITRLARSHEIGVAGEGHRMTRSIASPRLRTNAWRPLPVHDVRFAVARPRRHGHGN